MKINFSEVLTYPVDEPVDHRRNEYHVNFVSRELLTERLTAQSYRPDVVNAIADLKNAASARSLANWHLRR